MLQLYKPAICPKTELVENVSTQANLFWDYGLDLSTHVQTHALLFRWITMISTSPTVNQSAQGFKTINIRNWASGSSPSPRQGEGVGVLGAAALLPSFALHLVMARAESPLHKPSLFLGRAIWNTGGFFLQKAKDAQQPSRHGCLVMNQYQGPSWYTCVAFGGESVVRTLHPWCVWLLSTFPDMPKQAAHGLPAGRP